LAAKKDDGFSVQLTVLPLDGRMVIHKANVDVGTAAEMGQ
jgi:hypothetical protein